MKTNPEPRGIGSEVRLILRRARQVWRLVPRPYKFALGTATVIMAVASASNTLIAVLLGRLVDALEEGVREGTGAASLYDAAAWVLGLIAGTYVVREALNVLRRYLVENSCTRINRDMSVRLVGHLMKVDLGTLSQEKVGAMHGRIFRSVDGLVRFLRLMFLDSLPAVFTGAIALATGVGKQPLLGLVMVGVIPTTVFLTVRQLISQKGVRLKLMRSCEEIDGALVEQLGGMEYVRAANTHRQEVRRLAAATERRRAKEIRHHFQMSLFGCAKALNEGFFHILVLGLAIYLAVHGQIRPGDVIVFSMLFLNVMTPLSEIHRILDEGHEASLRVGDLLEMLSEPVDRSFKTPTDKQPLLLPGEPAVVVDNLQVEYQTAEGKIYRALHGISLAVRHGETIGIAGRSGCGKSTWLKVLLRLIHPCGGSVVLGGVPLEEVSRGDIGRLLGYVGQNPFVFAGTIAENIAYGNGKVTPEDVERVARLANLHEEVMAMAHGYQTEITERGQNLSGGQRQRLAIARILLKNAPILILDEATSALDNISERHVHRSLGLTRTDRTTILVAHRLSTLRDADRILVFDAGRIVESGTYDHLLQQGGVFAELVMSGESGPSPDRGAGSEEAPAAEGQTPAEVAGEPALQGA